MEAQVEASKAQEIVTKTTARVTRAAMQAKGVIAKVRWQRLLLQMQVREERCGLPSPERSSLPLESFVS